MAASLRRLASDHASLHRSGLPPYYLLPGSSATSADDLTQLHVLLAGPSGTPFEDGLWRLQLKMPSDYPKSPPKAFFRTKIWHPNVDESSGSVCLDTLKRDWESKLTLRDILVTISCLLINPNPDSALNAEAGRLLQEDWNEFARHARLMTSIHAKVPHAQQDAVSEARNRGEETETSKPEVVIAEDESEDEEENTKENDHVLQLPVRERRMAICRPTVLGKRPLADLPVPLEPPSDDEEEVFSSARNIAANTPNLSNSIASISFDSSVPAWPSAVPKASKPVTKLTERSNSANGVFRATAGPSCSPPSKRHCVGGGKENLSESVKPLASQISMLGAETTSTLTAKMPTSGYPSANQKAMTAERNIARPKARIGLRRL